MTMGDFALGTGTHQHQRPSRVAHGARGTGARSPRVPAIVVALWAVPSGVSAQMPAPAPPPALGLIGPQPGPPPGPMPAPPVFGGGVPTPPTPPSASQPAAAQMVPFQQPAADAHGGAAPAATLVPPHVESNPIPAADAGGYCFAGPHPVDTRSAPGPAPAPWDEQQGQHLHPYPPFDLRLFSYRDGCYHFVGDPRDFGYSGQAYNYYGAHPILAAYGGGWCFMLGGHSHVWRPWSTHFTTVGPWHTWAGPYDPFFWTYWPYYSTYYRQIYPHHYGGGRFPRGGWTIAPPLGPTFGSPFGSAWGSPRGSFRGTPPGTSVAPGTWTSQPGSGWGWGNGQGPGQAAPPARSAPPPGFGSPRDGSPFGRMGAAPIRGPGPGASMPSFGGPPRFGGGARTGAPAIRGH